MSRILHLSDPHFGTEQADVLQAVLQLAKSQAPDLVLLTGDITQRARRSQFAAARHFVDQLPTPLLTVPGNHDIPLFNLPARWLNPYGNYRRVFGKVLEPEFESDSLLVIGVNTTRAANHTHGAVSAAQIERVARRLGQARPGQLRLVMQHHPVCAAEESDLSNLLIGREQAIPAWVDAGLDLLIAGHIHLPYVRPLTGTGERIGWTAQAGTALSQRVRGLVPNSVNLIIHGVESGLHHCAVERWDYAASEQSFVRFNSTTLSLSRNP